MAENETRINLLLDLCGALLSEKQKNAVEMYYGSDMSITEIAEELSVSRQAAHNTIRRGVAELEDIESKLGLLERFSKAKEIVKTLQESGIGKDAETEKLLKELEELL